VFRIHSGCTCRTATAALIVSVFIANRFGPRGANIGTNRGAMMRSAILLMTWIPTAWAQASGSITGTVTDSVNRLPLHHVLVSAANGSRDVSAADGSFTLFDLPAGEVKLHLVAAGYRPLDTSVKVSDGDHLSSYFELHPMAHITGKVIDKDTGEPISRQVALVQRGRDGFMGIGANSMSDKNGVFELNNIEPGDYTLELDALFAEAAVTWGPEKGGSEKDSGRKPKRALSYGQVAYPETIHIAEGEQKIIDMRVAARESHSVAGSVEFPPGYEEVLVSVGYGIADGGGMNMMQNVGKHRAGPFRLDGLSPGAYLINVTAGEGAARAYGSVPVTVKDEDIEGLAIKLAPGLNLTASIAMAEDGASPPKTSNLLAVILATRQTPGIRTEVLTPKDGRFHAEGVARGEYWPELDGLPDGYAVTGVLFDGASTAWRPVLLNGSDEITFVVTSRPGIITGTVRDQNQATVKGAEVTLLPDTYRDVPDPPVVMRMLSGASGEFKFKNLPPGRYSIEGAPPIDLQPGQTATITVFR
jgi:hypothetical protein